MECVMFGIGGAYVLDVDETLYRLGWRVRAYVANVTQPNASHTLDPVIDVSDLDADLVGLPAVIPVATPGPRRQAVDAAQAAGFCVFPSVVDPTSVLARSVTIDEGAMVNALVVIAPNAHVTAFATLNRGCSIGHDTVIGQRAFLGPSVVLSGGVHIGEAAFLGAGSIVRPEVRVGAGAIVGAGAVVVKDVEDGATVVGNPARPVEC